MSSKPIIVWGDPPVKARAPRQLRFTAHVESLKERPGQWACIRRHPNHKTLNSMRNTIRNGKAYQRLIEPGRVELVVRRTRDGEDFGIWARWIPPEGRRDVTNRCTCGERAPAFQVLDDGMVEARPTYDLECPEHGLDALLAQATPGIDIDEEGGH